jgi:hypothetical protein
MASPEYLGSPTPKNYSKYGKYKIVKHIYWLEEKKQRF